MKERPILFSGPMVRAILEGRKTQTRRIVKPQRNICPELRTPHFVAAINPHGKPGDRLWVKETFYCDHFQYPTGPIDEMKELLYYRERDLAPGGECFTGFSGETMRVSWRPSIFMPRWASRITLQIEDVRVQHLHDITEDDAWAEGCRRGKPTDNGGFFPAEEPHVMGGSVGWDCAKDWYADLWDDIHGEDAWSRNPWVWVIIFKRI